MSFQWHVLTQLHAHVPNKLVSPKSSKWPLNKPMVFHQHLLLFSSASPTRTANWPSQPNVNKSFTEVRSSNKILKSPPWTCFNICKSTALKNNMHYIHFFITMIQLKFFSNTEKSWTGYTNLKRISGKWENRLPVSYTLHSQTQANEVPAGEMNFFGWGVLEQL